MTDLAPVEIETSVYDELADIYDTRYDYDHCPPCKVENDAAVRFVTLGNSRIHSLLDLGCGTGLALDLGIGDLKKRPGSYLGVDPSSHMLDHLVAKHDWAHVEHLRAEDYIAKSPRAFHTVISLFGSPSYIEADTIRMLPLIALRRLVLMHYKEGYFPDYYDGSDALHTPPATADASREAAANLAGAEVTILNNMQITIIDRSY